MKYTEGTTGRAFVLRLEDREIVHSTIESFAREHYISSASVSVVGGVDKGSVLVVGPEHGRSDEISPVCFTLEETHEATGTGTIFLNEQGEPILHMHICCGRGDRTVTGCVREGVYVWHILEVIISELTGIKAVRKPDKKTGFELLEPEMKKTTF